MAQLVARLVRNEKVGGSNPPSSTTDRHPIVDVGFSYVRAWYRPGSVHRKAGAGVPVLCAEGRFGRFERAWTRSLEPPPLQSRTHERNTERGRRRLSVKGSKVLTPRGDGAVVIEGSIRPPTRRAGGPSRHNSRGEAAPVFVPQVAQLLAVGLAHEDVEGGGRAVAGQLLDGRGRRGNVRAVGQDDGAFG